MKTTTPFASQNQRSVLHCPPGRHDKPSVPLLSRSAPVCWWHQNPNLVPPFRTQPTAALLTFVFACFISLRTPTRNTDNYNVQEKRSNLSFRVFFYFYKWIKKSSLIYFLQVHNEQKELTRTANCTCLIFENDLDFLYFLFLPVWTRPLAKTLTWKDSEVENSDNFSSFCLQSNVHH